MAAWQTLLGTRGLEGPDARVPQDQWQLLQGIRLLRSGSTPSQVVSRLGYRDESALAEAHLQWLGAPSPLSRPRPDKRGIKGWQKKSSFAAHRR